MSFIEAGGSDCRRTAPELNSTTVFNPRASSRKRFSSKLSMSQTYQSQQTKPQSGTKVALVGQQSPFRTILNNDLVDEDFDFAFTVQGKQDLNRVESMKNSVKDFNLAYAVKDNKGFAIFNAQQQHLTRSLNQSLHENNQTNQLLHAGDGSLRPYATSVESQAEVSSQGGEVGNKSYNFLTGASMTQNNAKRLD